VIEKSRGYANTVACILTSGSEQRLKITADVTEF
jgi:hypothetical protein